MKKRQGFVGVVCQVRGVGGSGWTLCWSGLVLGVLALGALGLDEVYAGGGRKSGESSRLIAHEWGTFTSVQGSKGVQLEGLHHEEEALPGFVHSRSRLQRARKGMEGNPRRVTQKMETPVIYFYTKQAQQVRVEVKFPDGIISQWYPSAVRWTPFGSATRNRSFVPQGGSMRWDVMLRPGAPIDFPKVGPESVWAPSRWVPKAVPVHSLVSYKGRKKETERFIFYRGLGRFRTAFKVVAQKGGHWSLRNHSPQAIPTAFLLRVGVSSGGFVELGGPLKANGTMNAKLPTRMQAHAVYLKGVMRRLSKALVRTGLYQDEAWAMVNTWKRSYFLTPGTRVLYIVPRRWTETLLPLKISPNPSSLVRTLVGRVEVLTPEQEQQLVGVLERRVRWVSTQKTPFFNARKEARLLDKMLHRFTEPKLQRACQLSRLEQTRTYCRKVLAAVARLP